MEFCVDCGLSHSAHGGMDGGAVGVDGIVEKDINLAISLTLRDLFEVFGYNVIMTRETDISIHDPSAKTVKAQKTSDLNNRLKIAKENANGLFISIHQNKFTEEKYSGAQVFFSPSQEGSEMLAGILQRNFIEMLQPDNRRDIKKADKSLFLMMHSPIPSVLVECGFLSNWEEAHKLTEEEYQDQIAFTIFSSVMDFLQ